MLLQIPQLEVLAGTCQSSDRAPLQAWGVTYSTQQTPFPGHVSYKLKSPSVFMEM